MVAAKQPVWTPGPGVSARPVSSKEVHEGSGGASITYPSLAGQSEMFASSLVSRKWPRPCETCSDNTQMILPTLEWSLGINPFRLLYQNTIHQAA